MIREDDMYVCRDDYAYVRSGFGATCAWLKGTYLIGELVNVLYLVIHSTLRSGSQFEVVWGHCRLSMWSAIWLNEGSRPVCSFIFCLCARTLWSTSDFFSADRKF